MLAGHWELNVRSNNKMWTRLLVLLVLFIQSKFTKKTQHKQITIIQHRGLINYPAEPFSLWLNFLIDSYVCFDTHQQGVWFGQQTLCSALSIFPSRQPDHWWDWMLSASCVCSAQHPPAESDWKGEQTKRSVGWRISAASPSVLPAVSTSIPI